MPILNQPWVLGTQSAQACFWVTTTTPPSEMEPQTAGAGVSERETDMVNYKTERQKRVLRLPMGTLSVLSQDHSD